MVYKCTGTFKFSSTIKKIKNKLDKLKNNNKPADYERIKNVWLEVTVGS
jgi:hypothetical protein